MPLCYKIDIRLKISKEQKKAERGTRYASILNLYNCYKMDTVWARAQNFKIEKTCGRELLTAGLGLRYKKDTLLFEKKNIFFRCTALLFKYLYSISTSLYEMQSKPSVERVV